MGDKKVEKTPIEEPVTKKVQVIPPNPGNTDTLTVQFLASIDQKLGKILDMVKENK